MKRASAAPAVAALWAILVITAAWWALALWPAGITSPEWLRRTREVCFGAAPDGLPDAGGWILLVGQPIGMLAVLVSVWPAELRAGLARLTAGVGGQVLVGAVAAAIVAGIGGVAVRVLNANGEPFAATPGGDLVSGLTRMNDAPPAFSLVDQHGRAVTIDDFRGRPVIVTFAFAHCETVCPMIVSDVLEAAGGLVEQNPAVVVFTLDPWRDTPARLPAMATAWRLTGDARVLSGEPDAVDRVLNAWRIPRVRNTQTGDLSHPALVYVLDRNGRIAYALQGNAPAIAAAVRAL